jgi:hypothetical protein
MGDGDEAVIGMRARPTYLGVLCRRGHDHDSTGMSIRYGSGHCIACFKVAFEMRMLDPEKKAARDSSNARSNHNNRAETQRRKRLKYAEDIEKSRAAAVRKRTANIDRVREIDRDAQRRKRANDPESCRAAARQHYRNNRISHCIRNRVYRALHQQSVPKTMTVAGYGIDIQGIARHLGPCPGSPGEWHIDHIRPLSSFDFSDPSQVTEAFAPCNHQWLTANDNRTKAAKYAGSKK